MIYTNLLMSKYLITNKDKISEASLDKDLETVLEKGFLVIGDCIFLEEIYPSSYSLDSFEKEDIETEFLDYSGYEYFTNKFHIEDFTDEDPFVQSIIFCKKLKEKLLNDFIQEEFVIIMSFQDDEIGRFVHFSFHKRRANEIVYDVNDINSVEFVDRPTYIEIVTQNEIFS